MRAGGGFERTGLPLADLIAGEMVRQGLTLKRVAQLVRKAAAAENDHSQVHEQLVWKWRAGQFVPNPSHLRWLADALQLPVELLTGAAEAQRVHRAGFAARPALVETGPVNPELSTRVRYARRLDEATLDHLDTIADYYAHQIWVAAPRTLLLRVWSHHEQLRALISNSPPANQSRRLMRQLGAMSLVLGRLARHTDNRGNAVTYWAAAEELAAEAGDESLRATALIDRTHYSSATGALNLLDEAERHINSGSSAYLRAWLFTRKARVLAASGMAVAAYQQLERAAAALDNATTQPSGYFAGWSSRWLASYEADCAVHLGQYQHATDILEGLLASSQPAPYHKLAILLDLALAYAHQREVQRSCGCLSRAIDVGATFELSEQLQRLAQLRRRHLSAWRDEPAVRQLDEQLHTATRGLVTP